MSTTAIRLTDYEPEKANLLLPVTTLRQQLGPWHELRVTEVKVNPDPSAGEVFKVGAVEKQVGDKRQWVDVYALGRAALDRIAAAAGIIWDFRGSGPELLTDRKVIYRMVGAVRLPDGTWQPIAERKLIDLDVVEEEVRERQRKRGEEKAQEYRASGGEKGVSPDIVDQWVEQQVRSEMLQRRKSVLQLAETGARLRCIRALLAVKSHYTREELAKPFVVPRIDFSPDYNDPEVRRIILQHGLQATSRLFGPAPAPALPFHGTGNGNGHEVQVRPVLSAPAEDLESETLDDETERALQAQEPAVEAPERSPASQPEPVPEPKVAPAAAAPAVSQAAPANRQATAAPQAALQVRADNTCEGCGKVVSAKVLEYSRKRFGRTLCYDCQREVRGGAA